MLIEYFLKKQYEWEKTHFEPLRTITMHPKTFMAFQHELNEKVKQYHWFIPNPQEFNGMLINISWYCDLTGLEG